MLFIVRGFQAIKILQVLMAVAVGLRAVPLDGFGHQLWTAANVVSLVILPQVMCMYLCMLRFTVLVLRARERRGLLLLSGANASSGGAMMLLNNSSPLDSCEFGQVSAASCQFV